MPSSSSRGEAIGLALSPTLAGPPERITAFGTKASQHRLDTVVRMNLAIDAALAQAAGNQLGNLAAEIDDQHAVVVGSVRRQAISPRGR